jgi:hypothetical protein
VFLGLLVHQGLGKARWGQASQPQGLVPSLLYPFTFLLICLRTSKSLSFFSISSVCWLSFRGTAWEWTFVGVNSAVHGFKISDWGTIYCLTCWTKGYCLLYGKVFMERTLSGYPSMFLF